MNKRLYVQYGCGFSAPKEWLNFDASPTLKIQKIPILGWLLESRLNVVFPEGVKFGDIIKGLPVANESCDGMYCSHTLEHLALNDFRKALKNTHSAMKKGAIFRCVVPDLEVSAREYVAHLDQEKANANHTFLDDTLLGKKDRKKGFKAMLTSSFGNAEHQWMWDYHSLCKELEDAGFSQIRRCSFNDSEDEMFKLVEDESRFKRALAIECRKV